jgi:cytochrome c
MRTGIALSLATVMTAGLPLTAHAQDGEALFRRQCATCHAVQAGQNKIGPSMAGVVGKKAASVPGFQYSDAMKAANITWTDDALAKYLADPKGLVPNGKMVFAGLKKPDDVQAVIDYMKTLK